MSKPSPKKELFAHLAVVAKALGNANRLEILEFLAQGERSVDVLAELSGLTVANTSQHLQELRRAGLVEKRSEGKRSYYSLSGMQVIELLSLLRIVAEDNLAEIQQLIQQYLESKDDLEPIARDDLMCRALSGEVTVLDVRPEMEFECGHLPRAVNIPFSKLEDELKKLPRDKEVIAYCRGPYCLLSFDAVVQLRQRGYKARRLEDGFPEWKLHGLPVE